MAPTLDIIIVNWNAGKQLFDCLHSLLIQDTGVVLKRVTVVDNGSTDDSLDGICELGLPLRILRNETNRGFAAACNQGAAGSDSDFLLFLNPDTLLSRDSLTRPITFLGDPANSSYGIIGIQLLDETGKPGRHCCRFPAAKMMFHDLSGLQHLAPKRFPGHFMSEWAHDENRAVDHVIGAFFLMRHKVFEDVQGFDERFFVYKEDLDLSLRAKCLGWHSYYLADARAFHKGGGSSEQIRATRLFYALRSRIQYASKHFSRLSALWILVATLVVEPCARCTWAIKRRAWREIYETASGTLQLVKWVMLRPLRGKK